jgi:hypothetical protein
VWSTTATFTFYLTHRQSEEDKVLDTDMKNKIWNKRLNFLIALTVLAMIYSLLGVLQAGMLSGAPNYSRIRAEYNEHLWTSMSGVFFGLSVLLIYLRVRR